MKAILATCLCRLWRYRDRLGVTLFQEEASVGVASEVLQYQPEPFTTESYMVVMEFQDLWYTLPGLYTFIVRWVGSPATRETGRLSLFIKESVGREARS